MYDKCSDCEYTNYDNLVQIVEKQQKEFIKYLENKINMCDGFLVTSKSDLEEVTSSEGLSNKTYIQTQIIKNETAQEVYEEILQKYKEIIGDDK